MRASLLNIVKKVFGVTFVVAVALQVLFFLALFALLTYFYFYWPCKEIRTTRTTAPNARTDAVQINWSCGALGPHPQKYYLVSAGTPISEETMPVLVRDGGIANAVWISPEEFRVTYEEDHRWFYHEATAKDTLVSISIKKAE